MFPFDEETLGAIACYYITLWVIGALIILALIVLAIIVFKRLRSAKSNQLQK
jgi:flagellar biogenesis protein FliO